MPAPRELRLSEKTIVGVSITTLCVIIGTVAGTSWFVGGKYEHWDNWGQSVMQFIRDQRTVNAEVQQSLEQIKRQMTVQKADAR